MPKPPHANDKKRTKDYQERQKRQKGGESDRGNGMRKQKESFLIFCVGKNTEPQYFKHFKTATIDVVCPDETAGEDPLKMVETVLKCLPTYQAEREKGEAYQHVWIVFDKDNFPDNNFNNAISKANANDVKVAWSNQAFEYWFVLHFIDHQGGGLHRDGYYDLINQHLNKYGGEKYDKDSKNVSREMFDILAAINSNDNANPKRTFRKLACQRAESIYKRHQQEGNTPAMSESCTSVFELVELLDT